MFNDPRVLKRELQTIRDISTLTEVFEHTASIKIKAVRQRVLSAKVFFNDLWQIYSQLRVDVPHGLHDRVNRKDLLIFIASPAGLSGQLDQQNFEEMMRVYKQDEHDVLVIGSHGAQLLRQAGIKPVRAFETPDTAGAFTVQPIVEAIANYNFATAFYQSYVSLTVQHGAKLQLLLNALELSQEERDMLDRGDVEIISPENFLFEPSIGEVVRAMERVMLNTSIDHLLQESRLAQLAGRFTTMTLANQRAEEATKRTFLRYLSAKRSKRDEMTRQIMAATMATKGAAA